MTEVKPIVASFNNSLVKRKTSTNLGSNRKKFNVNTTNIYSIVQPNIQVHLKTKREFCVEMFCSREFI